MIHFCNATGNLSLHRLMVRHLEFRAELFPIAAELFGHCMPCPVPWPGPEWRRLHFAISSWLWMDPPQRHPGSWMTYTTIAIDDLYIHYQHDLTFIIYLYILHTKLISLIFRIDTIDSLITTGYSEHLQNSWIEKISGIALDDFGDQHDQCCGAQQLWFMGT